MKRSARSTGETMLEELLMEFGVLVEEGESIVGQTAAAEA